MHAHHMLHDGSIVPSYAKISENGGIKQGLEVKSNFDQRYVGCDLNRDLHGFFPKLRLDPSQMDQFVATLKIVIS